MKHAVAVCLLLSCCGVLLGDSPKPGPLSRKPAPLLQDLVRLTNAGSSDVTVLAYAKAHRLELPSELSDSDLRWLRDSGVSELVVRYMTAIDVRASRENAQEDVAYGSDEGATRPRADYSNSESDDDSSSGGYPERYAGNYGDNYGDSYFDAYPGYDYYPSYGYGYYPYPLFFVDRDGFFHRFRGRDHRFDGHRGFDRDRGFRGHPETWRDRGFSGRRGSAIVVGPRVSRRPTFARGGLTAGHQGPRGRAFADRGFGSPHVSRGPRAGASRQGFGRPGFSGGSHGGGGFSRSPRASTGSVGERGRR
ncbi:MAG TPA: hypothetical protein VK780_02445 [Thermoanaerobaculia bacterium]|nr:hypothetical protein [Thermoanaerobaculia bacterium]